MATLVYQQVKYLLATKAIDLVNDTIKIMLMSSAYTPSATSSFVSDISANEVSGTYSRQTLGSRTVTRDDANTRIKFDAADILFTGLNVTSPVDKIVQGAAIYKDAGAGDSSNPLIAFLAFTPGALTTNGSNVTVTLDVLGYLLLT